MYMCTMWGMVPVTFLHTCRLQNCCNHPLLTAECHFLKFLFDSAGNSTQSWIRITSIHQCEVVRRSMSRTLLGLSRNWRNANTVFHRNFKMTFWNQLEVSLDPSPGRQCKAMWRWGLGVLSGAKQRSSRISWAPLDMPQCIDCRHTLLCLYIYISVCVYVSICCHRLTQRMCGMVWRQASAHACP